MTSAVFGLTSDEWTTTWAAVTALATLATASVAILTLLALRRDSRDRTRPIVLADLVWPPIGDRTLVLVVANRGPTPAWEVRVSFTPDPLVIEDHHRQPMLASYLLKRYAQPVAMLAPGSELKNVWWVADAGQSENQEPLPDDFVVHLAYKDGQGKRYKDSFPLSVGLVQRETYADASDRTAPEKRVAKALEAIARGVGGR